jgi:predicted phage tail protein
MKTVYLYGKLGKRFGRKWSLNADSAVEVFAAIEANKEGFLEYLARSQRDGVEYAVLNKSPINISSKKELKNHMISESMVEIKDKKQEMHIVPAPQGNAAVIMTVLFVGGTTAGGLTLVGKIVVAVAVSFVVGAIMKALFKPPERKTPTTTKSYLLKGTANRQSQGVAVPLGYGRLKIGATNISQHKISKRKSIPGKDHVLESYTEIEFLDLLSEGPIAGLCDQNGNIADGGDYLKRNFGGRTRKKRSSSDLREGIFLNNVPVVNTPISEAEVGTANYILNENGEQPVIKKGEEKDTLIISDFNCFVIEHGVLLYGAGPYTNNEENAEHRDSASSAKKNGAKIAAHFVANKNVNKIRIEMNTSLSIQNDDGSNQGNNVQFVILMEKDYVEHNVLSSSSGCTVSFDDTLGAIKTDESNKFIVTGLCTSLYAFDIVINFERPKISSRGITFKLIKLSNEYDPSVKGALGGIGRDRSLKLSSVAEYIEEPLLYPHSAIVKLKFDSKNFSNLPDRSYHAKLKKVLIPSNYDPISKHYDGPWNGLFKGQSDSFSSIHSIDDEDKHWTDNPAWVFYDLLSNARYGVGKYGLYEEYIDKWQLYKISKYCDELVRTDYEIETSSNSPVNFTSEVDSSSKSDSFSITIDQSSYSSDDFIKDFGTGDQFKGKKIAFFVPSRSQDIAALTGANKSEAILQLQLRAVQLSGEIKIEQRDIVSSNPNKNGGGTLIVSGPDLSGLSSSFQEGDSIKTIGGCAVQINHAIVEPRFSSNLYITDESEALQLINNMASIFRGIVTFYNGKIMAIQDSYKNPIQLFNNSNVSVDGFAYSGVSKDQKITSSIVRYNNKDDSFKPATVQEEDKNAIRTFGFKEKETLGFGITSSSQARRLAKWVLYTTQLETETVSFETSAEASYLYPGSIFEISDEMRVGKSKSGRILDIKFYTKTYEFEQSGGNRVPKGSFDIYSPYILLDKHMLDEPFVSMVELTVCTGLTNSTEQKLNLRAPFERASLDQDAEIESVSVPQVIKFECSIGYNSDIVKKGPQGQSVIASDFYLKIPFEISLSDNTFSIFNHGFVDGDRIRFTTEGSLPSGISMGRRGSTAYYIKSSTKHTFKISSSAAGDEVNVSSHGLDTLGNDGGLHYICPEDEEKTKEALTKVMIGSSWSAKGLMAAKTEEELEQVLVDKLDLMSNEDSDQFKGWEISSWLGWLRPFSNDWGYATQLGWVYLGELKKSSGDDGFWFYTASSTGTPSSGWIWTNDSLKETYWFFYSLYSESNTASGWVIPYYDDRLSLIEFFVYDSDLTKQIGDSYILNDNKYIIVQKSSSIQGYFIRSHLLMNQVVGVPRSNLTNSSPSDLGGLSLNQRRETLTESGYYKEINIDSFDYLNAASSLQAKESIRINLSETHAEIIKDGQEVFIEGVTDSSGDFDDYVNVVYVYDNVDKRWTTSVDPWALIKINDYQFELVNSSPLVSKLNSSNITSYGKISFTPPPSSEAERVLEGQLFRTMSVKEKSQNRYEIVGLEYNQSKFDAVDKQTVVRQPVMPIPPQADMRIPEAPDTLILTDLTI